MGGNLLTAFFGQVPIGSLEPMPLWLKVLFVTTGLLGLFSSRPYEPARKNWLLLISSGSAAFVTKLAWMASLPIVPAAQGDNGRQLVSPNGTELPKVMFSTSRLF